MSYPSSTPHARGGVHSETTDHGLSAEIQRTFAEVASLRALVDEFTKRLQPALRPVPPDDESAAPRQRPTHMAPIALQLFDLREQIVAAQCDLAAIYARLDL